MYIKRVIIQGFRSYRDQTCPEDFNPRHNIIVGRNGSGKSNFFQAIQFVLSDEYSHLSNQDRQNLLHEGTGPRVISAYVEIIFDNGDNRIPIEKNEVSLRRIIGSKKDQYYLDKKMVTKADVMNLLESAGFSKSNPYYIVKQGKITQLAVAPDTHRLKLLREVAGTRVYDERKEESKLILKETETKREKINELLQCIEERLKTLESETKELKEYQRWDRERRALEYTIHDRELKETKKKLEELQNKREMSSESTSEIRKSAKSCTDAIQKLERELRDNRLKEQQLADEREQIQGVMSEELQKKERLELTIADTSAQIKGGKSVRARTEEDLQRTRDKITEIEQKLEGLKPEYEEARRQQDQLDNKLSDAEHRRKELYAKQGRGNQFQSKQQRDEWIKNQMRGLNKAIKDKENTISRLKEEIRKDETRDNKLTADLQASEESMVSVKAELDKVSEDLRRLRREKDETQNDRQTVYREETNVQQQLNSLRDELNRISHNLRSITGKGILNGLDSVRKVVNSFRERYGEQCDVVQGYHGTLIEVLDSQETFYTCVEVTSGSRLFYHLVDNDKLVIKIIREIDRLKLPGDVNFFPLNVIEATECSYPGTTDVIPMISRLQFNDRYRKVMVHLFGRTLICRSIEIATQLARTQNFDCITLEGDQVSRKGTLTGGYYDTRLSRLEMQKTKQKIEIEIAETENVKENNRIRKEQVDTMINKTIDDLQRKETVRAKHEMTYEKLKTDVMRWKEEHRAITESRPQKDWKLSSLQHELEQMKSTRDSYQAEVGTDLLSQLSVNEQGEVDRLNDKIQDLTRRAKEAYRRRMRLESEKSQLETQLYHNLFRKREQLERDLNEVSETDLNEKFRDAEEELTSVEQRIKDFQDKVDAVEGRLGNMVSERRRLEQKLEEHRREEKEYMERMQEDQHALEKMQTKQSQLLKKKDECMKKICELGSLPGDVFEKYADKNLKGLFKLLDKANRELKKYSHVNKKALDQFVSFSDQKEKLLKRKDELDTAHASIVDLMSALDHRKYEAIQFTFKQVSKYFQEIFKRLVPEGRAELVMRETQAKKKGKKKKKGAAAAAAEEAEADEGSSDDEGSEEEAREPPVPSVERFEGVGIRVSFTGQTADMKDMNQLSGGQKSLVALTMIFAIQKCDPAPFYLFDEIDAALDAQYRRAVAEMINDLCSDAQFITTTFRPELLAAANKYYGVKFRNKVSHIECVTKEEALDFVEDDQTYT